MSLQCSSCGVWHPASFYSRSQKRKRSRRRCKSCVGDQNNGGNKANKQKPTGYIGSRSTANRKEQQLRPQIKTQSQAQLTSRLQAQLEKNRYKPKFLVFGYVRTDEIKYEIVIPLDIVKLLIRFLGGEDCWDKDACSGHIIMRGKDDKTIVHSAYDNKFGSAYLSNIIRDGKHCWKFLIEKMRLVDWSIIIGIYNIQACHDLMTQNYPFLAMDSGYCYFVKDAAINDVRKPYTQSIKRAKNRKFIDNGKNTVSLMVDLDKNEINWYLNEAEQFDNDELSCIKDGMYRVVVTLTQTNNAVTLLSYDQLN